MERLPFLATRGAEAYDGIAPLPVCALLHDIRSMYNVGAILRTADAAALARIYLSGICPLPSQPGVAKTALGAEHSVEWRQVDCLFTQITTLRQDGFQIAALETTPHAVDLFDWKPQFPVCLLLGNEVDGLPADIQATADVCVRIPMLGMKYSLNVATAAGVVMYELLRKYRVLREAPAERRTHPDGLPQWPHGPHMEESHA
ncbi:MAG: TrmH family RNA methyltransferase [Bryobacterales bacterium]|jgi:tRNA G18 (ribose-2'-O)-methylase SpoU|nr:TrmH family RNA methyltransferase [Bryobacterales bacterium]